MTIKRETYFFELERGEVTARLESDEAPATKQLEQLLVAGWELLRSGKGEQTIDRDGNPWAVEVWHTEPGRVVVSETAEQHGFGSDPYKWVSKMTPTERATVREGGTVVFQSERLSGGKWGTLWREAKLISGRFYPRVPSPEVLEWLGETDLRGAS